jgi:hypothetical protein
LLEGKPPDFIAVTQALGEQNLIAQTIGNATHRGGNGPQRLGWLLSVSAAIAVRTRRCINEKTAGACAERKDGETICINARPD